MLSQTRSRRTVLQGGAALALATAADLRDRPADAADATPFSSGTEAPAIAVPPNACDCHIHILSTRYPASPHWKGQPVLDSDVAAYRQVQARLGTSRVVVVTPSTYGTDNRPTLDGVAQFGPSARAVVVVDRDVTDAELRTMAGRGAVGIRVNFGTPQSWGPTTAERLETMARKVAPLGWHVQIYATGDTIVELEPVLSRLPTPLVIDHLARLPPDQGVSHPAYAAVRRLLDGGRTWMKLSGAYLNTASGPPAYADATAVAKSFAAAAPERVVWGSDWPHRGEKHLPDDARLLDLLAEWVPDDRARARVLVDNPAALYGFG
ncbi:amidohydrolase family protein [Methylobacterium radiotolerans]|jgi:D-galactarolactone isomerase|uniref:amidohydrolase family protein n=1 Tax=Methylobacterium TaxID=407 RepID=UPI0005E8A5CD|nr:MULTISPECIES: amidohydrolase family protein [Methylobacterium]MBN6822280.1 amidohydrolase family protein [Methylobacterium organophilum]OXE40783.1 2-pyrone-4,6-dicarboxylate hydrolase [Methylobacterium radiotolerans]GAN50291.1 amidohydrolase 2 [Methylobacterium sp. ME121]